MISSNPEYHQWWFITNNETSTWGGGLAGMNLNFRFGGVSYKIHVIRILIERYRPLTTLNYTYLERIPLDGVPSNVHHLVFQGKFEYLNTRCIIKSVERIENKLHDHRYANIENVLNWLVRLWPATEKYSDSTMSILNVPIAPQKLFMNNIILYYNHQFMNE